MVDRLPGADDFRQRVDVARIVVQPALEGGLLRLGEAALAKLDRPARRRLVAMIETVHSVTPFSSLRLSRRIRLARVTCCSTVRTETHSRSAISRCFMCSSRNRTKFVLLLSVIVLVRICTRLNSIH